MNNLISNIKNNTNFIFNMQKILLYLLIIFTIVIIFINVYYQLFNDIIIFKKNLIMI